MSGVTETEGRECGRADAPQRGGRAIPGRPSQRGPTDRKHLGTCESEFCPTQVTGRQRPGDRGRHARDGGGSLRG